MLKCSTELVEVFNRIDHALTRINPPEIDLCEELVRLVDLIEQEPSDNDAWIYLGEFGYWTCADLVVGAFWALTEWHGGQYSEEYGALSRLGDIFSPGMTSAPESEEDGAEWYAYQDVSAWFESKAAKA